MSQSSVPRISWTDTGPVLPESADIKAGVEADYKTAAQRQDLDVSDGSIFGQLATSETAIIENKNADIMLLPAMFNPETSSGVWQDALGKIYFLTRHPARATVVACECRGLTGTEITVTELARSETGHLLKPVNRIQIPASGVITANFECVESGPATIPAGAVNTIYKGVPGWDSITNVQPGTPGRDVESAAEFEERRKRSVAINAQGNLASVYAAVAGAEGVLDLYVAENTGDEEQTIKGVLIPGHSIYVSVSGGDAGEIAAAILAKKSGGCGMAGEKEVIAYWTDLNGNNVPYPVLYHEAANLETRVQVIVRDTGGMSADVIELIKQNVVNNFYGSLADSPYGPVLMGQVLYASRFVSAVVLAGAQDVVSVRVSAGADANWYEYVETSIANKFQLTEDDVSVDVLARG